LIVSRYVTASHEIFNNRIREVEMLRHYKIAMVISTTADDSFLLDAAIDYASPAIVSTCDDHDEDAEINEGSITVEEIGGADDV
jgi:hypothetical protein